MDKNHPQGEEQIQASQKGDLETSTSETSSDSSTPTNYNETIATEITQGKQKLKRVISSHSKQNSGEKFQKSLF